MDDSSILSNAIASLEMEDLHPSQFDKDIALQWYYGMIDIESAVSKLVDHYKVES